MDLSGFRNPAAARDTLPVAYSYQKNGLPERIGLSSVQLNDGRIRTEARIFDQQGRLCLDYNKRIYFAHDGDGVLMHDYGTPTGSEVIEAANGKAAVVLIRRQGGKDVVEARNQDFKGENIVIQD